VVRKDRLLDFKLGDGWEPLCEFLGKTVPAEPYPHVNDAAMYLNIHEELLHRGIHKVARKVLGAVVSLAVVGTVAYFYRRKLRL